ncbi:cationic amino acid transporter 3-like [Clytia hemisphaerica]|uniref:Cationic amino acid transporter C-terminal domain-containing protein n=1 Tax=Clytia hemisphaerica TaxID=252671 RepID=A0A7M5V5G6_9CNID|eukprot:TCONS_00018306-protein
MGAALVAFKRCKKLDQPRVLKGGLPRVLGVVDLTFLGVGSTLGAGVYVVAADIAKRKAGPGVILSFLIAAIASFLCGLCYSEFGARVPKAGSAYVYAYVTIGELVAFIIGWNLVLEYLIGAAAVASAWSLYIDSLANNEISYGIRNWIAAWDTPGISAYPNFLAFVLCLFIMVVLILGVRLSSLFNTAMTVINLAILLFIICVGLLLSHPSNWSPFLPYGFTGVLRGSASAFFAFVGFDVIATSAEEVKNPSKTIPISIFATLLICLFFYAGVGAVLTLLVPYHELKADAALPEAFHQRGVRWAKYVIGVGAVAGLTASTASSMLPVPRLLYSMADDGLLFPFLGIVSKATNTPVFGTILTGVLASLLAFYFDLSHLVEMMSIGTLQAYTMVSICVLLLRYQSTPVGMIDKENGGFEALTNESIVMEKEMIRLSPTKRSFMLVKTATCVAFIAILALTWLLANNGLELLHGYFWCVSMFFFFFGLIAVSTTVICLQPQNQFDLPFSTPMVPFIPLLSIFFNSFLMMSLTALTWARFIIWMTIGLTIYLFYGVQHSREDPKNKTQTRRRDTTDQ